MLERNSDLFIVGRVCSALVITTNGTVKNDGLAVMGRGVALTARKQFKGVDRRLGDLIKANGNIVQVIGRRRWHGHPYSVVSFPVKHSWWEEADIDLIGKSTRQLKELADEEGWSLVALPRPGCGNGKLEWKKVRRVLLRALDDRFVIVNNEGNNGAETFVCHR